MSGSGADQKLIFIRKQFPKRRFRPFFRAGNGPAAERFLHHVIRPLKADAAAHSRDRINDQANLLHNSSLIS